MKNKVNEPNENKIIKKKEENPNLKPNVKKENEYEISTGGKSEKKKVKIKRKKGWWFGGEDKSNGRI